MFVVISFTFLIFIQTFSLYSLNFERDKYLSNNWNKFYDLHIYDVLPDEYASYREVLEDKGSMIFSPVDPQYSTVIGIKSKNKEQQRVPVYLLDTKQDTSLIGLLTDGNMLEENSIYLQRSLMKTLEIKEDDLVLIRLSKPINIDGKYTYRNYKFPLFVKEIKGDTSIKSFIFKDYLFGIFGDSLDKLINYQFSSLEDMFSFLFNTLNQEEKHDTPYYIGINQPLVSGLNNMIIFSEKNYSELEKKSIFKRDKLSDINSSYLLNNYNIELKDSMLIKFEACGKNVSKSFPIKDEYGRPIIIKKYFDDIFKESCAENCQRYSPYISGRIKPQDRDKCKNINLAKKSNKDCDFIINNEEDCELLDRGIANNKLKWIDSRCQLVGFQSGNSCWKDSVNITSVDFLSRIQFSVYDDSFNQFQCNKEREDKGIDLVWRESTCQTWSTWEDVQISEKYYIQYDFDRYIKNENEEFKDRFHENILEHNSKNKNISLFHTDVDEQKKYKKDLSKVVFAHYESFEDDSLNIEILQKFNELGIRWDSARWSQFIELQNNIEKTQSNILRLIIINLLAFILVLVIKFMLRLKLELHLLGVLKCFGYSKMVILNTYNLGNIIIILLGFVFGYIPFGILYSLASGHSFDFILGLYFSFEALYGLGFLAALITFSLVTTTIFINKYAGKENIYELIKYES